MPGKKLLKKLEELSDLKKNWYAVAETFEKYKVYSAKSSEPTTRLRDGCIASGYNLNTLNRMIAVKSFLDFAIKDLGEFEDIDPNTLSFPGLEIVKRAHQVNAQEGYKLLAEVIKGETTHRDLRERYNKLLSKNKQSASAQQIARLESKNFEHMAFEAIASSADKLFGQNTNVVIEKVKSLPRMVSAVAFLEDDKQKERLQIGFNFTSGLDNPQAISRMESALHSAFFHSNFYDAYWIIFSSTSNTERLSILAQLLDMLNIKSIGLAMVAAINSDEKGPVNGLKILRKPTDAPTENWQSQVTGYCQLFGRMYRTLRI